MPAGIFADTVCAMNKNSLEYLTELYSVEDGTCCITGPSWALRRKAAPPRARSATKKPPAAKRGHGLPLRAAAGK